MPEPQSKPLHELLSRDMVDIYVGQDNTRYTLHEKLLCDRSKFFRNIFKGTKTTSYSLTGEEEEPFKVFVGWLYSEAITPPTEEKELAPLFDVYLMAEKWEIKKLVIDVLETVRKWYQDSDTWPGLRRVQYIYAETEPESPMRQLLVNCVSRMLIVGDSMPAHWEKALRKNGQLAVDIIMCVQRWHIDANNVPDTRHSDVVSMVDEAESNREIKEEPEDEEEYGANGDAEEEEEEES